MTLARLQAVAREVVLTAGAVLGLLCILLALLGAVAGVKPLVFRSGSMAPAIDTGDLGIARTVEASGLAVGDIVSVITGDGDRVTHRVVAVTGQGATRQLQLRGDANRTPDPEVYTVSEADRVMFRVPRAGYAVAWLSTPVGVAVLCALTFFLLSVLRGPRSPRSPRSRSPRSGGGRRRRDPRSDAAPTTVVSGAGLGLLLVLGLGCGAVTMARTTPTLAAWTDNGPVSGSAISTGSVATPGTFTCTAGGFLTYRVTFTWTAVSGATGYTVHYGTGGAQTVDTTSTSYTYQGPFFSTTNGTAWVEAEHDYGSTTWTSAASATHGYTTALFSSCS